MHCAERPVGAAERSAAQLRVRTGRNCLAATTDRPAAELACTCRYWVLVLELVPHPAGPSVSVRRSEKWRGWRMQVSARRVASLTVVVEVVASWIVRSVCF